MQERTRPGTIAREKQVFESLHATGDAADSYRQALAQLELQTVARPQQITITLDCATGAGRDAVKAHGGGKAGVLAVARQEISATGQGLSRAGFTRVAWLSPREWGAWGRGIVDPASDARVDVRAGSDFAGVAPELAGPMTWIEEKDHVETDSAFHRAYWIAEWPRIDVLPGFLGEVVLAETAAGVPIRHTLQIVGTPTPMGAALKAIKQQRDDWKSNAKIRADRGQDVTIADDADWTNLDELERDLVSGHGQISFTGYLVVSALSLDQLRSSCSSMELAAAVAQLELMPLTYQQGAAVSAVAYPAGQGMR